MSKGEIRSGTRDLAALRKKAERALGRLDKELEHLPPGEASKLVHELRVHQIELDMQNEELRRAHLELEESRDRYADLYNFAPVGYLSLNDKGTIVEANHTAANMIGVPRRSLLGKGFTRFVSPELRSKAGRFFERVVHHPVTQSCELLILTAGGATKDVLMEGVMSEEPVGSARYCRLAMTDISDRRRAEEALRKARDELEQKVEERTRSLDQRMKEINCLYIIANSLTEQGISLPRMLQRTVELIPSGFRFPEHVRVRLRLNDLIFSTGSFEETPRKLISMVRAGDDATGVLEVIYSPEAFPDDEEPFLKEESLLLNTISDLLGEAIARSRNRTAIEESEARFRRLSEEFNALLDAIPDVIVLLSQGMKVSWTNKAAAEAGVRPADFGDRPCFARWFDEKADCEECPAQRSFASGRPETGMSYASGGRVWDISAFPVGDADGRPRNVIATARDITETLKLYQEMIRSAKLATLGELSASIAHEINNPVNSIINYAQVLADRAGKQEKEDAFMQEIIREGMRVASIVKSLLSFSRETKDRGTRLFVGELISASLVLANALMLKEGIQVNTRIPGDLRPVTGNAQQLQQVFLNIMNNARYALSEKYQGQHGDKVLEITAENAMTEDGEVVRIIFCDHGTGIPAAILSRVKEPFFTTKPYSAGTGLGLSISNTIVADHKGRLLIDSTEGEYTRITVELPADREAGI